METPTEPLERRADGLPRSEPDRFLIYIDLKLVLEAAMNPELIGGVPVVISQPALLEALVAEGRKHPSFEFRRGASVKEVLREGGRAVSVRVREEDGERKLRARLVIGADGRSSVVRRDSMIQIHADSVPMDIVWCKFPPLPDNAQDAHGNGWLRGYLGGGHLPIAYVSFDGQIQVGWIIFKGSYGELRRRSLPVWIDEMANHVSPDLAAHFRRDADQVSHPFVFDTASDRVRSWSAPGLLLLGDAAHTMSPVGAQGINVGLRAPRRAPGPVVASPRPAPGARTLRRVLPRRPAGSARGIDAARAGVAGGCGPSARFTAEGLLGGNNQNRPTSGDEGDGDAPAESVARGVNQHDGR